MLGQVAAPQGETPPEFETILGWADTIRAGHLGVRANADNGPDAANARKHGAEGIGLCRTEHMFLAEDRLPIVRRMILAATPTEEDAALEALRVAQKADFEEILEAMDGLPVTIRLLDPPLHEFLPDTQELAIKEATVGLTDEEGRLYEAAKAWHEFNPMLGTRGVRLGVIKPGLYAMQVRALMEAALDRVAAGGHPIVEIMIPLTVTREELALARVVGRGGRGRGARGRGDVARARRRRRPVGPRPRARLEVLIGTMIETPRAALRAGEIAEEADFFSFGTNDLTQMTFGFSRDDVEGRMMSAYLEQGLLKRNPFEVVDPDGVGELVRLGVERGRATRPALKIGVCGEHGGDPESIATFAKAGLDYVSCSPFRVPIARLAAAQAVLSAAGSGPEKTARPRPNKAPARPRKSKGKDTWRSLQFAPARRRSPCEPVPYGRQSLPARLRAPAGVRSPVAAARYRHRPWASPTRTSPGSGRHRHRRPLGEHAALKRVGRRWVGLCPFHGEKTPSFSVNAEEGFYYCFGCQAKGDAITFVRAIEHLDFVDAVRRLADKAGITIHEDADAGRDSQRRKVFLDAMEQATEWYHQRLLTGADAGQARDYLRSRGYDGEVVRRFRLGGRPTTGTPCAGPSN